MQRYEYGDAREAVAERGDDASRVISFFIFNTEVFQHFDYRSVHHRRSTHIVFTIFWCFMIFQVVFIKYVVNKAGVTCPVIFW